MTGVSALSEAIAETMSDQPHLTKSAMSRACGVTPTAVGRWVAGGSPEESKWPLIDAYLGWPPGRTAELVTPELTGKRRSTAEATTAALRARIAELEAELEALRQDVPSRRPSRSRSKSRQ